MTITSTVFQEGEEIPMEYTCEGANINPPLTFSQIPIEAESLMLIVEDPDAPSGLFTHWLLFDMSPATLQILENTMPPTSKRGRNSFSDINYGGPCPPTGKHRYFFRLYALDTLLELEEGVSRELVMKKMDGHVLEEASLLGFYQKRQLANPRNG